MMKTFLLLFFLFNHSACTDTTTVYICDSKGAKKYHFSEHCRGLSNCSHRVIKMSLDKAKAMGKTRCGWEK